MLVQSINTLNKSGVITLTTLASVPIAIDGEYGNSFTLAGNVQSGKASAEVCPARGHMAVQQSNRIASLQQIARSNISSR